MAAVTMIVQKLDAFVVGFHVPVPLSLLIRNRTMSKAISLQKKLVRRQMFVW